MHNSDVNPAHNHEAHDCNWRVTCVPPLREGHGARLWIGKRISIGEEFPINLQNRRAIGTARLVGGVHLETVKSRLRRNRSSGLLVIRAIARSPVGLMWSDKIESKCQPTIRAKTLGLLRKI
jgi:hypothetical protein